MAFMSAAGSAAAVLAFLAGVAARRALMETRIGVGSVCTAALASGVAGVEAPSGVVGTGEVTAGASGVLV